MSVVYNHNILIAPQYRSGPEAPVDAPAELGAAFVKGTIAVLDKARAASASFSALIVALVRCSHPILIYMARSKRQALDRGPDATGERNSTGDTLSAELLTRVEGTSYAKHRADLVKSLKNAVQGTVANNSFNENVATALNNKYWEFSDLTKAIHEQIVIKGTQRTFDELLLQVVEYVKKMPRAAANADEGDGSYRSRRRASPKSIVDPRLDCEVFTADSVQTPVDYYRPLYDRLGTTLHLDAALNAVPTGMRRETEQEVRRLLGRDQGPLDAAFLRKCEATNPKGYLMTKLILERYLLPNVGCGSNIIFNLCAKRADPSQEKMPTGTIPDKNSPWNFRPAEVALAHELIHAWRNAAGRTIFSVNSLEDESMVIGTANVPSAFPQFTENTIRGEMNLADRPIDTRPSMF
ncbi:hypothetical protein H7849_21315 [Alloacidobacterium dinghuense]|uniref:Uncharacterized protein n=1 Tax=Alloacidobacterium dinghuense TaxID=2763107 RepID=A0A7G8BGB2_9BACT|nr:hypothetical protein [Alloacidobacterium dinghuense]QNI31582.1 hypothetical protein H7849_21315 [Alloacidobacterium dinghuense]